MLAVFTLKAVPFASKSTMSMSSTRQALFQAEGYTASTYARCVDARTTAITAQNRSFDVYRNVNKLRDQAKQTTAGANNASMSLSLQAAIARHADFGETARDARLVFIALEKQLTQARSAKEEAELQHHMFLSIQGSLRSVQAGGYTSGPTGAWRQQVDLAFADYSAMQVFPAPPPKAEGARHTLSCRNHNKARPIEACECAVRLAFLGEDRAKAGPTINLRSERLRWAPDNFVECPEGFRVEFMNKAQYVFDIVEAMYQSIPRQAAEQEYSAQ